MRFTFFLVVTIFSLFYDVAKCQTKDDNKSQLTAISYSKSLNGMWDFKSDVDETWTKIQVPGCYAVAYEGKWAKEYWDVFNYPKRWAGNGGIYKKSLFIDESEKGKVIKIHFGGVYHLCEVYLNGKLIGESDDGYNAFELELTNIKFGKQNTLEVKIKDGPSLANGGESVESRGIWEDVNLKILPTVHIGNDVFVKTFVEKQQISLSIPVINASQKSQKIKVENIIIDTAGAVVLQFDSEWYDVKIGQQEVISMSEKWLNPELWFPHNPYLYHVISRVITESDNGKSGHTVKTRFGFREVSTEGIKIKLNGRDLFLRGDGGHYLGDIQGTEKYAREWIRGLKSRGVNFMRLHIYPKHKVLYDVADEEGFLFEGEPAFHFAVPEDTSYALRHLGNMVVAQRNHPSIIVWSVSNELRWNGGCEKPYLVDHVKTLDDTRPVFSSDFSLCSTYGDILGHHYDWNTVFDDWNQYGKDKPMIWDEVASVWQPTRPLHNGNAGYEVTSQDYATGLYYDGCFQVERNLNFIKDGKFMNGQLYRVNAIVPWDFSYNFFRWQPLNNNKQIELEYNSIEGVSGLKPKYIKSGASTVNVWDSLMPTFEPNPGYYFFEKHMQPVRFWEESILSTFYSSSDYTSKSKLFYDDLRFVDQIAFKVVSDKGNLLTENVISYNLNPGEVVEGFVSQFSMPEVQDVQKVYLVREFRYKGKVGYEEKREASVYPNVKMNGAESFYKTVFWVYDETGALQEFCKQNKIRYKKLNSLKSISNKTGLLLCNNYESIAKNQYLTSFIKNGGRCISISSDESKTDLAGANTNNAQVAIDQDYYFTKVPAKLEGSTYIQTAFEDHLFGGLPPDTLDFMTFNVNQPVEIFIAYDWRTGGLPKWLNSWQQEDEMIFTNDKEIKYRIYKSTFEAGKVNLGVNSYWDAQQMYSVIIKPLSAKNALEISDLKTRSKREYRIVPNGLKSAEMKEIATARMMLHGGEHVLLKDIDDRALMNWRGDAAKVNIAKPGYATNYRPLLLGDRNGETVSLYEMFIGKGIVVSTSLNITDKFSSEPLASYIFGEICKYVQDYNPAVSSKTITILNPKQKSFVEDGVGLLSTGYREEMAFEKSDVLIADGTTLKSTITSKTDIDKIKAFVSKGGKMMIMLANEDNLDFLSALTEKELRLTDPYLEERGSVIKAAISWTRKDTPLEYVRYYDSLLVHKAFETNYDPLLTGISNIDLAWGTRMFNQGIEFEGLDPVRASDDYSILFSNWKIDWSRPKYGGEYIHESKDIRRANWFINRDPVLLKIAYGEGSFLISQLDFISAKEKSLDLARILLTNMGCGIGNETSFATNESTYQFEASQDQLQRFNTNYYEQPGERRLYGKVEDNTILTNDGNGLPNILLLGGEEMRLIGPYAKKYLEGFGNVEIESNNINLNDLLNNSEKLLSLIKESNFEVVYFTFGLSDIMNFEGDMSREQLAECVKNLEKLAQLLVSTGAKVYWGSIPPLSEKYASNEQQFNEKGKSLMKILGVYVDDLNNYMNKEDPSFEFQLHANKEAFEKIGKQVNAAIRYYGQ